MLHLWTWCAVELHTVLPLSNNRDLRLGQTTKGGEVVPNHDEAKKISLFFSLDVMRDDAVFSHGKLVTDKIPNLVRFLHVSSPMRTRLSRMCRERVSWRQSFEQSTTVRATMLVFLSQPHYKIDQLSKAFSREPGYVASALFQLYLISLHTSKKGIARHVECKFR